MILGLDELHSLSSVERPRTVGWCGAELLKQDVREIRRVPTSTQDQMGGGSLAVPAHCWRAWGHGGRKQWGLLSNVALLKEKRNSAEWRANGFRVLDLEHHTMTNLPSLGNRRTMKGSIPSSMIRHASNKSSDRGPDGATSVLPLAVVDRTWRRTLSFSPSLWASAACATSDRKVHALDQSLKLDRKPCGVTLLRATHGDRRAFLRFRVHLIDGGDRHAIFYSAR